LPACRSIKHKDLTARVKSLAICKKKIRWIRNGNVLADTWTQGSDHSFRDGLGFAEPEPFWANADFT